MQNIKNWYQSQFPEDEIGQEINPEATFDTLKDNLPNVYDYLNGIDSVVRERVFVELSERMDVDYDHIYNKWLNT